MLGIGRQPVSLCRLTDSLTDWLTDWLRVVTDRLPLGRTDNENLLVLSSPRRRRKLGEEGVCWPHCRSSNSRLESKQYPQRYCTGSIILWEGEKRENCCFTLAGEHERGSTRDWSKEVETADVVTHLRLNSGRRGCKLFIEPATMSSR